VIKINGKETDLKAPCTVAEALDALGFDRTKVAVERNLEIVPKRTFDEAVLNDGDTVEVVSFVQGG
jgi:thiamine biosynthesis protein ThiS